MLRQRFLCSVALTSACFGATWPVNADTLSATAARGIVRAVEQAAISTELAARVAAVYFREGEAFKAGDRVLEFDCRRQHATLAAAEAQQLEMQLSVDKFKLLQKAQSVGKNDLEVAEARLAKAKAEADALRSQIDQCVVIAPFSGRVLELTVQRFEAVQPGKPFLSLVATGALEVDIIVPSQWVAWLKPGAPFSFTIDEIRRPVAASITRIGAAIDPISQTIKVSAVITGDTSDVLPGMSGSTEFKAPAGAKP